MEQKIVYKGVKKTPRKNIKLILLIILIGGVLLGTGFFINTRFFAIKSCTGNPRDPLYKEAAQALKTPRLTSTTDVIDKIKKNKNYRGDINCVYPVIAHNISSQKVEEAQKNLELMKSEANKGQELSPLYAELGVKSLGDIETDINELIAQINAREGKRLDVTLF